MGSQREEHLAAVRRERRSREFSNVDFIVQQGVQWRKAGLVGETRERERERERELCCTISWSQLLLERHCAVCDMMKPL